jgi:hypothetical protein
MKFVKIDNFWWEYDPKTPRNNATVYNMGLGQMTKLNLTNKKIVEANDWKDLNWKGTKLWDNTVKTGWLAPDGTFYGCKTELHITQAKIVHKKSESQLEQEGFVKITLLRMRNNCTAAIFPGRFYDTNISPTIAQVEYLEKQPNIDSSEVFMLFERSKKDANDDLKR